MVAGRDLNPRLGLGPASYRTAPSEEADWHIGDERPWRSCFANSLGAKEQYVSDRTAGSCSAAWLPSSRTPVPFIATLLCLALVPLHRPARAAAGGGRGSGLWLEGGARAPRPSTALTGEQVVDALLRPAQPAERRNGDAGPKERASARRAQRPTDVACGGWKSNMSRQSRRS